MISTITIFTLRAALLVCASVVIGACIGYVIWLMGRDRVRGR